MPRTHGEGIIHISHIDYLVEKVRFKKKKQIKIINSINRMNLYMN